MAIQRNKVYIFGFSLIIRCIHNGHLLFRNYDNERYRTQGGP